MVSLILPKRFNLDKGMKMDFKLPPSFKRVKIVSSEIKDGSMSRRAKEGRRNLENFAGSFGIVKPVCICGQPHRDILQFVEKAGVFERADGILSFGDFILAVKTADCIPLMLFEPTSGLIGAVHVSRQNIFLGIIFKSLKKMLKKLVVNPKNILFFLGPHIRVNDYQLSSKIVDSLKPKYKNFLKSQEGNYFFNLTKAVEAELEEIGAMRENVVDSKINTYNSLSFFSLRRQKKLKGVFVSLIFKND